MSSRQLCVVRQTSTDTLSIGGVTAKLRAWAFLLGLRQVGLYVR
jgi:hypothetical protein